MPGTFFFFFSYPRLCFETSILVNILKNAQKDDKFGSQLYFSILFRQPKNLFYWLPRKIIRSAETITFLVESRLSKVTFIVNAAIYVYVICQLGGPYSEKLWPRSWKCWPRPQAEGSIFKSEVTVFHCTDRPLAWSSTTKTISISRCESLEIELFYRKLSSKKRGNSSSVFHRISHKYSNDQRG